MSCVTSVYIIGDFNHQELNHINITDLGNGSRANKQIPKLLDYRDSGGNKFPYGDVLSAGINFALTNDDIIAKYNLELKYATVIIYREDDYRPAIYQSDNKGVFCKLQDSLSDYDIPQYPGVV